MTSWFGVRCLILLQDNWYEERITIWRAESIDDALEYARAESEEYATVLDGRFIGLCQAYGPLEVELVNGSEVFSLIRESALSPDAYISTMFDTGNEIQQ